MYLREGHFRQRAKLGKVPGAGVIGLLQKQHNSQRLGSGGM